jgi:hypothetical protein
LPPMGAPGSTGGASVGMRAAVVPVLVWHGLGVRRRVLLSMGGCLMDNRPPGRPRCDWTHTQTITNRPTIECWRADTFVLNLNIPDPTLRRVAVVAPRTECRAPSFCESVTFVT